MPCQTAPLRAASVILNVVQTTKVAPPYTLGNWAIVTVLSVDNTKITEICQLCLSWIRH